MKADQRAKNAQPVRRYDKQCQLCENAGTPGGNQGRIDQAGKGFARARRGRGWATRRRVAAPPPENDDRRVADAGARSPRGGPPSLRVLRGGPVRLRPAPRVAHRTGVAPDALAAGLPAGESAGRGDRARRGANSPGPRRASSRSTCGAGRPARPRPRNSTSSSRRRCPPEPTPAFFPEADRANARVKLSEWKRARHVPWAPIRPVIVPMHSVPFALHFAHSIRRWRHHARITG